MLRAVLVALAVAIALPGRASAEDLAALVRRVKPSVVLLSVLDDAGRVLSLGTGFVIDAEGLVATNHHVVEDGEHVTATFEDGSVHQVLGLVEASEADDLALVRLATTGQPALPLAELSDVEEGKRIMVLGNPEGLGWTVSEGIVSAIRPEGLDRERYGDGPAADAPLVQFTASATHGSSGSPVLDMDGKVLAVVNSMFEGQGDLNFAIRIDALRRLIDQADLAAPPRPFSPPVLARNLSISGLLLLGVIAALQGPAWMRQIRRRRML